MHKLPALDNMARQILSATEQLMAEEGLQNLSMQKIAKEAGIAAGTLYLYFKNKDDLLNRLVYDLYDRFNTYIKQAVNFEASLFEQFCQIWRAKWQFLQQYPSVTSNLGQYRALLGFRDLIVTIMKDPDDVWNQLANKGKMSGEWVELPNEVLFALSMNTVFELAYLQLLSKASFSESMLEQSMLRAWKAITI